MTDAKLAIREMLKKTAPNGDFERKDTKTILDNMP